MQKLKGKRMEKFKNDGGATNYYDVKDCKDVDDIAELLDLRGDEFNCLKAIFGIAIARKTWNARHDGTSPKRDAKKLKHYANRIEARINDVKSDAYKKDALDAFAKGIDAPDFSHKLKWNWDRCEGNTIAQYMSVYQSVKELGGATIATQNPTTYMTKFANFISSHNPDFTYSWKIIPNGFIEIRKGV